MVRLRERPPVGIIEAVSWGGVPKDSSLPRIPQRPSPDSTVPSSLSQQRVWRLSRLEPRVPVENFCGGVHLSGRLDVSALEGALRRIVERHESLRTTFEERNGLPAQVIGLNV